jgi:protein-ribulosamine 3-kinase
MVLGAMQSSCDFTGEHASLNAIHSAVPNFCPKSHAHGALEYSRGRFFMATDFLDLGSSAPGGSGESLARKLARLHTTPAPIPEGFDKPMFGFPATTFCGATPQDNSWNSSWPDFYAKNRLRGISQAGVKATEEVVYDPSSVYGHSEYELGIMRMFGGFGSSFWREYESLIPKAEPKAEWEDRIALYEL